MSELSLEQQFALQKFQRGENVFISGPGGSGKSHLIRYFVDDMHTRARIHQVTSTTGCSSILLSNQIHIGGKPIVVKTIHSWSGIRLGKGSLSEIVQMVAKNRRVVKEWRRIKTLILDEVSMLSEKLFTALEYLARMIRGSDQPFGGIQLVCLGDFFQLPPVGDEQEPSTMNFAFESPAWNRVFSMDNHVELVTIYRQNDAMYKQILHEVRHATLSEESRRQLETRVGLEYCPEDHHGVIPMKLFATRAQVQRVNTAQYEKIDNDEHVYPMTVQRDMRRYVETGAEFEEEVLTKCLAMSERDVEFECQSLTNQLPVEADVRLKIGAPVMCLVNLDVDAGIANGSMGVIVDFVLASPDDIVDICNNRTPNSSSKKQMQIPVVQFHNGLKRAINRYVWQHTEFPSICVYQMPLALAYATSIHKMQGATLDVCEMNLGATVFAEHQIYVALSRVKSLEGVFLSAFHPHRIRVNPKVVQFYALFAERTLTLDDDDVPDDSSTATVIEEDVCEDDQDLDKDKECPICMDDMDRPHQTTCGHRFCLDCLTRLISSTHTRSAPCPMCRTSIHMRSFHPVKTTAVKKTNPHAWKYATNPSLGIKSFFVKKS